MISSKIIRQCMLLGLLMVPFISSFASDDFYMYQDTNRDGIFDNRVHFRGDLNAFLSKYEDKSSIDTCWRHVEMVIYSVDCGNDPPCSYGYYCAWTGSIAFGFEYSAAPCTCIGGQATQEGEEHVYIKTKQNNVYSQVPVNGLEFNDLLFRKFQVVDDEKNLQRCDASFTIHYSLVCYSSWYCPSHTCILNPSVYITRVYTYAPICECYYYGPSGHILSKEGVICLLVLLIATTIIIMRRKQNMKTT